MANVAVSVAFIGKNNEPIFMREFVDVQERLRQRDLVDESELFGIAQSSSSSNEQQAQPTAPSTSADDEEDETEVDDDEIHFKSTRVSLKQEFILHAALDRFEQLQGPPPGNAWRRQNTASDNTHPMYVGLLDSVEDLRVYGYLTTTQIKIFAVVLDDPTHTTLHNHHHHHHHAHSNDHNPSGASSSGGGVGGPAAAAANNAEGGLNPTASFSSSHDTDVLLQRLFAALHQCYVSYTLNPFSTLMTKGSSTINSKRFEEQIQAVVARHNRTCCLKYV